VLALAFNALLFAIMGRIVVQSFRTNQFFARIESRLGPVDLLRPQELAPFARRGLRNAFLWIGGSSIASIVGCLRVPRGGNPGARQRHPAGMTPDRVETAPPRRAHDPRRAVSREGEAMRHPLATCRSPRLTPLLVPLLLLLVPISGARGAHFLVNSASDSDDGLCDLGHCSLREAIQAANASPGPDLVTFQIGSAIHPGAQLPVLTDDGTVIRGGGDVVLDGDQAGSANGLLIRSSHNRIQGLVIRDFGAVGVFVQGNATTGPAEANTIGTDGDGAEDALEGNVIHSNGGSGVRIEGSKAKSNVVAGNWIGTNAQGDQARGNGGCGVSVAFDAEGNRIGTDLDGTSDDLEANVVAANGLHGIYFGSDSNAAAGNIVGFGADGVVPLGNDSDGIAVYFGNSNTIGPDNWIGNNGSNGVAIAASKSNRVVGNRIGIDVDGSPAGNGFNGVRVFAIEGTPALGNQIGFTTRFQVDAPAPLVKAWGNVIAYSGWNGVYIDSHSEGFLAKDNGILFNSIYGNEALGIDLVSSACPLGGCTDGVTANDAGDTDGGGNDALNFPEIQSASRSSTHTYVLADIVQGLPNTPLTLQFFASSECDDSGNGEGELYLGQIRGTTDAAGNLSVFAALPVATPEGWVVTSTATTRGLLGLIPLETSEFSACAEPQLFRLAHLTGAILNLLQKLSGEGRMGKGDARRLETRLERALLLADRGREGRAARQLRRLQRRLATLERRGRLSPEAAFPLLASSRAAIEELAPGR
jgi:CSLREA domain-containing protein